VRSGRFGTVGLLQSEDAAYSILPRGLLSGIHDALAEHDLRLLLTIFPDSKLTDEGFVPKILRESSCDGLVINYNAAIPPRLVELIRQHRVPAVWVNSKHESDCVFPDDSRAGREATEHLLALGHRRVAYVDVCTPNHYSGDDRLAGYREAMTAANRPCIEVRQGLAPSGRFAFLLGWLSAQPAAARPTAAVTYNAEHAATLLQAAVAAGIRVPDQLSIVTVHTEVPVEMGMHLDTMVLPEYDLGCEAVRMLLAKVDEPSRSFAPLPLSLRFARGATAVPPLLPPADG